MTKRERAVVDDADDADDAAHIADVVIASIERSMSLMRDA